jgi:enoyl-CoA hydratase
MYESYKFLRVERVDGIVTVTLNRPEVKNATNPEMHRELERVFPEINADSEARVVVLTGAGRAFSAGGDLRQMQEGIDDHGRWIEAMGEARRLLSNLIDVEVPVIAKINGHAVGLGATLALFCDITIALNEAKIADPHVGVGLLAGHARTRLPLLTGDAITGAKAAEWGLVTEAHSAETLDDRVEEIAQRLANGAQVAIRGTKRALNMVLRQQLDAMIDAHLGLETLSHLSEDHRAAVEAFVAKRSPVFTGR